eukprot:Sdes_comp18301_c0_seq1m8003
MTRRKLMFEDLFGKPLSFYFEDRSLCSRLENSILENGGKISKNLTKTCIPLADETQFGKNGSKTTFVYSTRFIEDSIAEGRQKPLDDYYLGKDETKEASYNDGNFTEEQTSIMEESVSTSPFFTTLSARDFWIRFSNSKIFERNGCGKKSHQALLLYYSKVVQKNLKIEATLSRMTGKVKATKTIPLIKPSQENDNCSDDSDSETQDFSTQKPDLSSADENDAEQSLCLVGQNAPGSAAEPLISDHALNSLPSIGKPLTLAEFIRDKPPREPYEENLMECIQQLCEKFPVFETTEIYRTLYV